MSFPLDESITVAIEELRAKAKKADDQAREQCKLLSEAVESNPDWETMKRCIECRKFPYWFEWEFALLEGHVYTPAGRREFAISGLCEFCFDKATRSYGGEDD